METTKKQIQDFSSEELGLELGRQHALLGQTLENIKLITQELQQRMDKCKKNVPQPSKTNATKDSTKS